MKDTTLLQIAFMVAQESKCVSYKVGAVIAKNSRIISTGRNGTAMGQSNPDEIAAENHWSIGGILRQAQSDEYSKWAKSNIIHAEINAILFAARTGNSIDGATLYCTLSPCGDCAKAIAQSGIKRLVYCEEYNSACSGWSKYLTDAGVDVVKVDKKYLSMLDWDIVTDRQKRID